MADKYIAKFKMLTISTSFNEAALEDAFIQGPPQPILSKVYSQTSLPLGLDNWKTVMCNMDCLHRGFSKLKQSIHLTQTQAPQTQTLTATHWTPLQPWTSIRADPYPRYTLATIVVTRATSHMPVQNLGSKGIIQPIQLKGTLKALWPKWLQM